jgi:nucleotide-binding universal stress UspA family protein
MVFLVPFDGSPVSEAALARAVDHGQALGEDVVAVSFVPTGADYAERRKWIQPDEEFATETASAELRRKIEEATDDAERTFAESATAPSDGIADHIRQVATDIDASILFVGASDGDDRLTTPFGDLAADADYDVHIVRSH